MELQTRSQPDNFTYSPAPAAPTRAGPATVGAAPGSGAPAWPGGAPSITLRRVLVERRHWGSPVQVEMFELVEPISYDDRVLGTTITVPAPGSEFRTDLTSVPSWFTWLVPKSGAHLPAALVHDGLVHGKGPRTYVTGDNRTVDRIDADRVFRDAMRDTGVGVIRRWIVYAAVASASLAVGPRAGWPWWLRAYYWLVLALTFGGIAWLGTCATFEVLDRDVAWLWDLPWMVEDDWWVEAAGGLAGAVAVPLALSVLWGTYVRAGAVAGVALASLLHVTVAVGAVAVLYQAAEWVAMKAPGLVAGVAVVLSGAATAYVLLSFS